MNRRSPEINPNLPGPPDVRINYAPHESFNARHEKLLPNDPADYRVGDIIRLERRIGGKNLEETARAAGITKQHLSLVETNGANASTGLFVKIEDTLGLEPGYLRQLKENPELLEERIKHLKSIGKENLRFSDNTVRRPNQRADIIREVHEEVLSGSDLSPEQRERVKRMLRGVATLLIKDMKNEKSSDEGGDRPLGY